MQTLLSTVQEQNSMMQHAELADAIKYILSAQNLSNVSNSVNNIECQLTAEYFFFFSELNEIRRNSEKQFQLLSNKLKNIHLARDS